LANDSKVIQLISNQYSICSTVNRELQGIHIGDLHPLGGRKVNKTYSA